MKVLEKSKISGWKVKNFKVIAVIHNSAKV